MWKKGNWKRRNLPEFSFACSALIGFSPCGFINYVINDMVPAFNGAYIDLYSALGKFEEKSRETA